MEMARLQTTQASPEGPDAKPNDPLSESEVGRIRRFNRFYTQRIGVLDGLGTEIPLSQTRLLFEIESQDAPASVDVAQALDLDPGYVSRSLAGLVRRGWVAKRRCEYDGRRQRLELTEAGRELHDRLTERANAEVGAMLGALDSEGRRRVLGAIDTLEMLLGESRNDPCRIREHGPGDLGWVLQRHGEFYRQTFALDAQFEAMVAVIVADFGRTQDPERERLWIADDRGQRVGSILLVDEGQTDEGLALARLRLFFVEPHTRGRGVGTQLMETLLDFARRRGYQQIVLSTLDVLHAARRIYERYGFQLTREIPHADWTLSVNEEEWRLDL